jgi:ectoine hydroxylase-related dioxygenase (phytanoyl-CoA dioxygenase family)
MLAPEQVECFRRDGFLLGSKVLSEQEIDELQLETLRVIADRDDPTKPQPVLCRNLSNDPSSVVWQIVNIWEASDAFRRLMSNRTIVEEIGQLMQPQELRLWHDQIQYKPAATGGVNHWHQDGPYWPILQPKDQQVTAWVALDDAEEENGCMRMVPGSQLWGNQIPFLESLPSFDAMPTSWEGDSVEVRSCPVRKGHVHFHHSLTWHGSGKNVSGRPRRAIALHYMSEKTVYDPSDGDHVMRQFVQVPVGAKLEGEHFPRVF